MQILLSSIHTSIRFVSASRLVHDKEKKKEHVRGEAAVGLDDRLAGQAGLALQSIDILREATQQEALLV